VSSFTFIATACLTPSKSNDLEFYNFSVVQGSVQNWYRALCSPTWDDPAYMPQQRALTLGWDRTAAGRAIKHRRGVVVVEDARVC
jgi:hypothetical protein